MCVIYICICYNPLHMNSQTLCAMTLCKNLEVLLVQSLLNEGSAIKFLTDEEFIF